jgi:sugar phosphate isomerase/epimerase
MNTSRRHFLKVGLGFTSTIVVSRSLPSAVAAGRKTPPIGLQLYAVRGEFGRDVPGTLKTVKEMGYEGVEFWGYGGTPAVFKNYSATQLRGLLDDHGLQCCGMHLQPKALEGDTLQRTVENNQILGNQFLIVAAAQNRMGSEKAIRGFAAFLNGAATRCQSKGMHVGYHAHGFDFKKINGQFAWDLLFSQTRPEIVMQLDIGNCLGGGGDPIASLKRFPGRSLTVHIKEYQDKTFSSQYYKEVFDLCETTGATKWYIVEMGGSGGNGFDVPRKALAQLRRL